MAVDDAMVINIPSGLSGIRNMGLAKQPHVPSSPVLPYTISNEAVVWEPKRGQNALEN